MQLAELLKDWPCAVKGSIRTEIKQMQDVAQLIKPGDCYVARKGKKTDGKKWVSLAIKNGASAIVVDDEYYYDSTEADIPIIWVPNCQTFDAFANAKLSGFPSEALVLVAITGTNGKTTVSHFIGQLLAAQLKHVLVIGTIGVYDQNEKLAAPVEALTTLKPQHLQPLLKDAVRRGVEYVILEASSMGLAQHRLDACNIDIGVFLNLSTDHIEDHGSITHYKLAKQKLAQLSEMLIINQDDTFCKSVGAISRKMRFSFSTQGKADVILQVLVVGNWQTTCCIQYEDEQIVLTLPLVGNYQMQNVAAAVAVMITLGFSLEQLTDALKTLTLPSGRMQRYVKRERTVIIDYAHTTDALQQLLTVVKMNTKGKVIVAFSCGGERDKEKRKEMGQVASQLADFIILTTDNCRSEDPQVINQQIKDGFFALQEYVEILSREDAIAYAIAYANEGDTVVIVGKGHETTQVIGNVTYPFSDIETVENLLAGLDDKESTGSSS